MQRVKEASINIDCYYSTRLSHLRTEPLRDGTSARSSLKAPPTFGDAERPDATESSRVEALFEKREALACFMPGIVKGISAHTCIFPFLHQPVKDLSDDKDRYALHTAASNGGVHAAAPH
jgi:hypothetical protein